MFLIPSCHLSSLPQMTFENFQFICFWYKTIQIARLFELKNFQFICFWYFDDLSFIVRVYQNFQFICFWYRTWISTIEHQRRRSFSSFVSDTTISKKVWVVKKWVLSVHLFLILIRYFNAYAVCGEAFSSFVSDTIANFVMPYIKDYLPFSSFVSDTGINTIYIFQCNSYLSVHLFLILKWTGNNGNDFYVGSFQFICFWYIYLNGY